MRHFSFGAEFFLSEARQLRESPAEEEGYSQKVSAESFLKKIVLSSADKICWLSVFSFMPMLEIL